MLLKETEEKYFGNFRIGKDLLINMQKTVNIKQTKMINLTSKS